MQANPLGHTSSQQVYSVEHGDQLSTIFTEARAQGEIYLTPNDSTRHSDLY